MENKENTFEIVRAMTSGFDEIPKVVDKDADARCTRINRELRRLKSVLPVASPNPVAVVTNFCCHELKFNVVTENSVTGDMIKVDVYFLIYGEAVLVASAEKERKKLATKEAFRRALVVLNGEDYLRKFVS